MTMNATYREPTTVERQIVELLLNQSFPGRDDLSAQLESAQVREIEEYEDNYGSLEFSVSCSRHAPISNGPVAIAMTADDDGVPVEVLLHVRGGELSELEIVKADGSPLRAPIRADNLEVQERYDPAPSGRGGN
jgi:hypothetical protein